jgi:hypothetical protein
MRLFSEWLSQSKLTMGKWLGATAVAGMLLAPGVAAAQGWRGGATVHPVPPGARVVPAPVGPGPVVRGGVVPRYGYGVAVRPAARVWVPGYWGWNGGVRVWVAGGYSVAPQPGWVWVRPHWAWNGYGWVWQAGYWAPPVY